MCVREVEGEQCSTVQCSAVQAVGVGAGAGAVAVAGGPRERCRRKGCREPRAAGRKWTVGAGWLAGHAMSGRQCYVPCTYCMCVCVRGCRLCRYVPNAGDAMLCSGPALLSALLCGWCEREAT